MQPARLILIWALTLAAGFGNLASAQVQRSGGGGAANAQLLQQMQQAVSDRAQLQAENTKLKKQAEDLKRQLDAAQQQLTTSKAGAARNEAAVAAARSANETTQRSLDDAKARMQEVVAKFRETIATMREIETERSQLKQQLAAGQAAFDKCAQDNEALYQVDNEVLDRYAHQGAFAYLARSEPFTQLKRTQIENLVIEYRQRAEELRMKKAETDASGATARVSQRAESNTPAPANPSATPVTPPSK